MAKGPQAFRTISEAADELGVPQHVLRFWETRFSFIRPMKRAGGRRFYRPQDIAVLAGVRALLHRDGMSIKAVQALYKEEGVKRVADAALGSAEPVAPVQAPPEPAPAPAAWPAIQAIAPEPSDDPYEPDLFAPTAPASVLRPRLTAEGRARLAQTLFGLEAIKARLDSLLAGR